MKKRNKQIRDLQTLRWYLRHKRYIGGKKLILYLLSQGKSLSEMLEICLDYTKNNIKKFN